MTAASTIDRRRMLGLAAASAVAWPGPLAALGAAGEVRFGLTAVVVRETVNSFNLLARYLTRRLGRPVVFVQRRSYADIMLLLKRRELDAAWICGYPFVKRRSPEFLDLLVAPIYAGAPLYRSLIIAPQQSDVQALKALAGRVFAYSDPDSNSGYLAPRALLRDRGYDPDRFFRLSFFTYSHAETVMAVAERMADGGAVDSYVYDVLRQIEPRTTERTRVIHRSMTFGFPPIVVRRDLEGDVRARLAGALTGMAADPSGAELLARLSLDGFSEVSPALYDSIRELAERVSAPAEGNEG